MANHVRCCPAHYSHPANLFPVGRCVSKDRLQKSTGYRHRQRQEPFPDTSAHYQYFVTAIQGPSVSTDTACSSSLVAAHLAHRHLTAGDTQVHFVSSRDTPISWC